LRTGSGANSGGFVGDLVNSGMLALVNSGVAAFIYVLLIIITTLFILRDFAGSVSLLAIWRDDTT
jgi:hypothetical protein